MSATIRQLPTVMVLCLLLASVPAPAQADIPLATGETIYVPIYSNVFSGPRKAPVQLAAMLSIRNTDPKHALTLIRVDYYDNDGRLIERYLARQTVLAPLASTHFYVKEYDTRGGPGANFIVTWQAGRTINRPIIQGIMLGLASGQGLSFVCPGQPIHDWE